MSHQGDATGLRACLDLIDSNDFVWALGSLCQLNRVPFDPSLVLSQVPPPYDWSSLVDAAVALGFRCELSERDAETIDTWAFPSVVFLRAAAAEDGKQTPGVSLALLVRADGERVLM